MVDKNMSDTELDKLLAASRQPELPVGFAARLQERLEQAAASPEFSPAVTNVVAFPRRIEAPVKSRRVWLSAIPLAASLAFGIYVGAMGSLPESLSGLESSLVSDAGDTLLGIGIEDTESFLNGDLS